MFIAGLVQLLGANSSLTALVAQRIRPTKIDFTEAMPAISYTVVHGRYRSTLDRAEILRETIQFDIWAYQYSDCETVARALRNILSTYTGTLSEGTRVLNSIRTNQISRFEDAANLERLMVEYEFLISEP